MKANELMIGDWIAIDEPDRYAGATGQIKSLQYHQEGDAAYFHVFIQGKFGYVLREVCSDDIRPIPLTPEILEKNGFRKSVSPPGIHARCYELDNKKDRYNLTIADYNKYKRLLLDIDSEDSECFNIKCDYVHQLQQALRLCGIKKTIEL